MKIDISQWKKFHLYDDNLFEIDMGTKLDKSKMTEISPTINFVGRANSNNGITSMVDKIDGIEPYEPGNLTLSLGGEYLGSCFIQPKPFYTSQNVIVLIPKRIMSDNVKRFISTVIFKEGRIHYKAFINELNRHIKTDFQIYLPVDFDGNPDWNYMEEYMEHVKSNVDIRFSKLEKINKCLKENINTNEWKEFRTGDLFDIHPTKSYKLTNAKLLDDGQNPVIANSAYNNGIVGYSTQATTERGNMITFSDTVDANTIFYQENDFVGYAHVQGLYPKEIYEKKWNKYSLTFFASMFRATALAKSFSYGNKFKREIAMEMNIKLPVDSDGNPDWQYMEDYMKEIEKRTKDSLSKLTAAI